MESVKVVAQKHDIVKHYVERCMHSYKRNKVFCLVEGELDKHIYQNRLNHALIEVCIAEDEKNKAGYAKVIKYVSELRNAYHSIRIIGIRDKDYSVLLGREYPEGIFYTDCRDLEMMVLSSCSYVASDTTIPEKMSELSDYCRYLAYLRIFNDSKGNICNMKKKVKMSTVYDDNAKEFRQDWKNLLIQKFIAHSNPVCSQNEIESFIADQSLDNYCDTDICRGHDVVSLMGMVYGNQYHQKEMETKMNANYSNDDFYSTNLFSCIQDYCASFGYDARFI